MNLKDASKLGISTDELATATTILSSKNTHEQNVRLLAKFLRKLIAKDSPNTHLKKPVKS